MDAAFFRFLGPELADALLGDRFDTVFSPAPGFWTLAFTPPVSLSPDSPPDCRFLLARVHSRAGVLLLSPSKPVNPLIPPARAMWLRKRLRGRKVMGGATDWPRKRLALELSPGEGRYLLLTMEDDPAVLDRLPDGFGMVPAWASPDEATGDPTCPRSLRAALGREEAEFRPALLESFLIGRTSGFFLSDRAKLAEGPLPWSPGGASERFPSALQAAQSFGQEAYFGALAPPEDEPARAQAKRSRRLALLDQDQSRLEALAGQQFFGEAVAANLSLLDPRSKIGPRTLEHPARGPLDVPLDPSLTILENMERFFRKAAKGRRGKVHVERLRREAESGAPAAHAPRQGFAGAGKAALEAPGKRPAPAERKERGGKAGLSGARAGAGAEKKARPGSAGSHGPSRAKGRDIALRRFRSSDGFLILRGKNSAANHKLLSELASPFDFWFHAEGGPGAHVILKRDNPGQEVPEGSLREAAVLAGLSSWRAADAKASVLVAQCSEVRKMKGAALGQVRLERARTLLVDLDPALEERLLLDP